jgi:hypothetical protein
MPGLDGTGPQGKGPLTGKGLGYCVLRESAENPNRVEGWAGIDGVPVGGMSCEEAEREKEVTKMPRGNGTGPLGMGPMTGRGAGFGAGYPVPGYRNPGVFGARQMPYGAPAYGTRPGYVAPRFGWFGRWLRGGFGLGRGFGRGRGRRGGFGCWW